MNRYLVIAAFCLFMAGGTAAVLCFNQQLNQLNGQLIQVNTQVGEANQQLKHVNAQLAESNNKLSSIDARLVKTDQKLGNVAGQMAALNIVFRVLFRSKDGAEPQAKRQP